MIGAFTRRLPPGARLGAGGGHGRPCSRQPDHAGRHRPRPRHRLLPGARLAVVLGVRRRHQWEPLLALIVAAVAGDEAAHRQVEEVLDRFADTDDWAALVRVLRRVLAGEREPSALLAGLDAIDTAIVTRLVARLRDGPGDDS